jgi:chromosome segregation ATPase
MGADNLDKMNIQFIEKENSDTISKLNSQLDYINKENNRLHKTIADLRCKNKGNTGMYYENCKVVDRIENLKKKYDDLRRTHDHAENVISELKTREAELVQSLQHRHVDREKYEEALQTIKYQQQDIDRLKKFFEVTENQRKIETHVKIASEGQQEGLDMHPERERLTPVEATKLKTQNEQLTKKIEQFRNEINAISGKYLGAQRSLELLTEDYKNLKVTINDLEKGNSILRDELNQKEKEIEVMVEYLKDAQPMAKHGKENIGKYIHAFACSCISKETLVKLLF